MKKHNYYLISFFTKRLKLFTATTLLLTAAITTHAQTWTQAAKALASDGQASDEFGMSVDIDGDYAIVGAIGDDDKGTDAGAAYVFVRSGTTWTEQAKLTANDGAAGDYFGMSVSIDGDYALIGAYWEDQRGTNAGAAYVFVRSGTSWSQQAKITASDGAAYDDFGWSVSIDGDYAVVGSYINSSGSAYIFVRSGTSWTQQAKLLASDGAAYDYFGYSVFISGGTALVGAYKDDNTKGTDAGSAYFFRDAPPVCESTNALPTTASTTYTGAYATTDANGWTHYCSSDDKLLLSLDTAGSGAVVAANEVQLKLGASTTTSHGASGGMVTNADGYILIDRLWDVSPTTQPTGDVGVRYYFTAAEYSAFVTAAAAHKNSSNVDKPTTITAVTDMEFYKNTSGAAFDMPHTASGLGLANDATASTSNWLYAAKGTDHSAEFKVTSFSGGGAGVGAADASFFEDPAVCLSAKAYLQGALLLSGTSTMNDDLRAASLIPSAEPYTSLSGFTHAGSGGGETAPASVFTPTGNDAIVDWVFVELRDKTTNTTILETRSALLQRDGDIVDAADGTSNVCFTGLADPEVYVSVRHRNHLGAMIAATKTLTAGGTAADFSTETLYGTNATTTVNSVSALRVGNVAQDGKLVYRGAGEEYSALQDAVLNHPSNGGFGTPSPTYTFNGYTIYDLNMSGVMVYRGANEDASTLIDNVLNHPSNGGFGTPSPTYIVEEQLP